MAITHAYEHPRSVASKPRAFEPFEEEEDGVLMDMRARSSPQVLAVVLVVVLVVVLILGDRKFPVN